MSRNLPTGNFLKTTLLKEVVTFKLILYK
jgi:hypothetical protein